MVYAEKVNRLSDVRNSNVLKRSSDGFSAADRPVKAVKRQEPELSRADIETLVDRMVEEKLANRALVEQERNTEASLSAEVQRRLDSLEQRVEKKEDSRAEGLQFLLMAKQHHVRGEEGPALKMYRLALPFFPDNEKLAQKILVLQDKIRRRRERSEYEPEEAQKGETEAYREPRQMEDEDNVRSEADDEYKPTEEENQDESIAFEEPAPQVKSRKKKTPPLAVFRDGAADATSRSAEMSPRTASLLRIINSRDIAAIKMLKGVGAKKAEAIVNSLCSLLDDDEGTPAVRSLEQLGGIKGVGAKTVESMRMALAL